ncbi:MAG: CDP-glycerol glycerophosphotransferase family protein [Patescibacteria group bacterium]
MKTLFLFIPNYVYSSDLLYTHFIRKLAERHKIIVFSPVFYKTPSDAYYQSPNIVYIPWEVQYPAFWLRFNKTFRWSLLTEFDYLEYHKLREKTGINLNAKRSFLKFIAKLIPKPFKTANFFTALEQFLLPNAPLFKKYVEEYKPAIILTATPGLNGVEAEAILLAKKNGLKTAAINFSWDNLFNTSKQIRKPDYLICWNNPVKQAAHAVHRYPSDRVFVSGIMRFDHHITTDFKTKNKSGRAEFLKTKGLDPNLKTILYTTVPPQIYPFQTKFLEKLIRLRDINTLEENFNIYVRLHPRDEIAHYANFQNIKNVHIENAGDVKNPVEGGLHKVEMNESDLDNLRKTLSYADLAVNFRSSLTLETCLYDIPTINLAYNGYGLHYQMDHYIPILKAGAVQLAHNEKEFIQIAKAYLKNPAIDSEKRLAIAKEYVPFQDGLSYQRNVDFLEEILETKA